MISIVKFLNESIDNTQQKEKEQTFSDRLKSGFNKVTDAVGAVSFPISSITRVVGNYMPGPVGTALKTVADTTSVTGNAYTIKRLMSQK